MPKLQLRISLDAETPTPCAQDPMPLAHFNFIDDFHTKQTAIPTAQADDLDLPSSLVILALTVASHVVAHCTRRGNKRGLRFRK